jgi:hypothetical protein
MDCTHVYFASVSYEQSSQVCYSLLLLLLLLHDVRHKHRACSLLILKRDNCVIVHVCVHLCDNIVP